MFDRHGGVADRLSPQALAESLARAMRHAPRGDLWVFAYGSLLWNPVIHHAARRPARLHGYHRRYCLWSYVGRGTRERPGLMLGLERGGSCVGAALRIPRGNVQDELALLWRREMIAGSYAPRWLVLQIAGVGRRKALVFTMDRRHPRYAGRLAEARVAKVVNEARGPLGSCREYFEHTRAALAERGTRDAMLERLRRRLG
ncbi:MAG: gamma-glutamylcyclotransferase [Gammaproteobacteria bacterium]